MTSVVALLMITPLADPHGDLNSVFQQLRDPGVAIGKIHVALPAPAMADGLDAKSQRAIIDKLAGNDIPVDELLRRSPVAPHILKQRALPGAAPDLPCHGIDVWYIAYGSMETLGRRDYIEKALAAARKDRKVRLLTADELAKRKLSEKSGEQFEERYNYASFSVLDRVLVSGTNHVMLSRSDDSLLLASELDPRFAEDTEFPNRWQSMEKDDEGMTKLGTPTPYAGSAGYLKVTRLVEPKGALFVEYHQVFAEPRAWFGGANLLRSKIPIVVQGEVRALRREMVKTLPME
jgi:hypothetical protein